MVDYCEAVSWTIWFRALRGRQPDQITPMPITPLSRRPWITARPETIRPPVKPGPIRG